MNQSIVCQKNFIFKPSGASDFEVNAILYKPERTESGDFSSIVTLEGYKTNLRPIVGVDQFQSLFLALKFIGNLFYYFVEDGGVILDKDGYEVSVAEIFPR